MIARRLSILRFAASFFLLLFALSAQAHAASARPDAEAFFQNPAFSGAVLSPDARNVAILVAVKDRPVSLAIYEIATKTPKIIAHVDGIDIDSVHWVNDNRLVFDLQNRNVAQGDLYLGRGLYGINRDGSQFKMLVERSTAIVKERKMVNALPWDTDFFDTIGAQDTDDVYVIQPRYDSRDDVKAFSLLRLNTLTGRANSMDRPGDVINWLADRYRGQFVAVTHNGAISAVHYRDPATQKWRKLAEFNAYTEPGFAPFFFGPDGTFYVKTAKTGDKYAIHTYDLTNNRINPEPLVSLTDYDFEGSFEYTSKQVLGAHFEADAPDTVWFDAGMKAIQKAVDALMPGMVNRITVATRAETPYVLVKSFSDVQPPRYWLYDTDKGSVVTLGDAFKSVDPRQMSQKDMVRYQARDGLAIPAYLTLPAGTSGKNLPMVVLVHGGPYVRGGSWRWNPEVQFLASRGYAVLEPEFRGSTGFGFKHFKAGWKQWGLAMQNDIADGAKWAIAQGIADPKRICIAGASYGGYATLMGLVNDPDLFRCGINWVGVTDIDLMYSVHWSDFSDVWKRYGMPALVGDREKDAAQLRATSPLLNASRIKQPMLLAYGGSDRRVPRIHGTKFRDAVKEHNKDVEWIEYPEEGHGWYLVKNRVDFWNRVEKFLERNIGK